MEYIIYSDESDRDGKFFGNFYGAALVRSADINYIEDSLRKLKIELNLNGEIKWTKVSAHDHYIAKYKQMIDMFFDFIRQDKIKVRIMFTQNIYVAQNLSKEQKDNEFKLLYYQFLKNAFGFKYCDETKTNEQIRVKFYFDDLPIPKLDSDSFKDYIYRLDTTNAFGAGFYIRREDMAEVDSKNHVILQCLDIILGAMCFRLNDKHLEKPLGKFRRSKKTVYKEKLFTHISTRIREIRPGFNIGMSTSGDLWKMSYAHWKFVPQNHTLNVNASKHKSKAPLSLGVNRTQE